MTRALPRLTACAIAACAALAACGEETTPAPGDAVIDAMRPAARASAIALTEAYSGFGAPIQDVALLANPDAPWLGRGVVLLADGTAALIDLTEGVFVVHAMNEASTVHAAAAFQLRGSPAPLVITAGGEARLSAYIYDGPGASLLPAPLDLNALGDAEVLGACVIQADEARLDLALVSTDTVTPIRIRDAGADALSVEALIDETAMDDTCPARLRGEATGASDVDFAQTDGVSLRVEAREDASVMRVGSGAALPDVDVTIDDGINAQAPALQRVAVHGSNFGGSYNAGVVLVADQETVGVIALDDVVSNARAAPASAT